MKPPREHYHFIVRIRLNMIHAKYVRKLTLLVVIYIVVISPDCVVD